jgi:hypothetical protein
MPIPVHPSDTLAVSVVYDNSAGAVVPETGPTTWSAEDLTGAAFAGVTLTAGADDDHETGTFADPAQAGSFTISATMTPTDGSAVIVAKSDEIDVSVNNTPTSGVVQVAVTPGA